MLGIFKRLIFVFVLAAIWSACLFQNNFAEAKANIKWTTTKVTLASGKCTIYGYFSNTGNVGATPTNIRFIVDTTTSGGSNIWSDISTFSPTVGYIAAGATKEWWFAINNKLCPKWTGKFKWNVKYENLYWK